MMLSRLDPFVEFGVGPRRSILPADVYRIEDTFYVEIDVPGVSTDDIDLEVDQKNLTVSVERRGVAAEDRTDVIKGRAVGTFTRKFFLGDSLDPENITASCHNGVLTLSVPVIEAAKARKITVARAPGDAAVEQG